MKKTWSERRKRVFEILEVGADDDYVSRSYDYINAIAIIINIVASIMLTYEGFERKYGAVLLVAEEVTVAFFCLDYLLRIWTAKFLYPDRAEHKAIRRYMLSFTGVVDMLSFLPYYLPFFMPAGTVAFRMIRIVRIFRLFRINAYYDSLSVITEVIYGKRQQLISSVSIILILMIGSSLCMYSLEHEVQPEVFNNAFSGIWWASSTLLTVGYGDIYPVTTLGKLFGIVITFLGVGMVAIPTGIISAGFVDQYSNIKKRTEYGYEEDMQFIKIHIKERDKWNGKSISQLQLPAGVIIAMIKRGEEMIIPRGNIVLKKGDGVILGAEPFVEQEHEHISLKEITLQKQNPWNGMKIRDLDISRHAVIVLVKREGKAKIPYGDMVLKEGDNIFLYTHRRLSHASEIEIK
ncbi:MAG: ion transporter [Schaedlerella sp.]|nr:ion transporter [Schaedlerella sp.]